MKKKISVITASRADYGLLRPIIRKLEEAGEFEVVLAVTGAHLAPEFGYTYQEIEKDGFAIEERIDILLSADTPCAITKSMGLALLGFGPYFEKSRPDLAVILGDRYEMLAVAIAAMNQRIPIAHLYGGETTEGAVDEAIRHAITKLSYLHFTSAGPYRRRVIQLGESPDRVFTVGAAGIENILKEALLTKEELKKTLRMELKRPYALVTFHPVTLEENQAGAQIEELLNACGKFPDMDFIFTGANADAEGRIINQKVEKRAGERNNLRVFPSLGSTVYLSALKYCSMALGNSSSGLLEAPSFGIPTINIGDRQKGRLKAASVIECGAAEEEICRAIETARKETFRKHAAHAVNPYGDGNTSEKIAGVIRKFLLEDRIDLKKRFYDWRRDYEKPGDYTGKKRIEGDPG